MSSVEPRCRCSMQSIPRPDQTGQTASSPKTCAVTRAPLAWAASIAAVTTSSDHEGRRQSPIVTVDPVADQLDPAVAALCLQRHRLPGAVSRPRYRSAGAGHVPLGDGPDADRRELMRGKSSRSSRLRVSIGDPQFAQQQRTRPRVQARLSDRVVEFDAALRPQPDMAMRIDQPGQESSRRRKSCRRRRPVRG